MTRHLISHSQFSFCFFISCSHEVCQTIELDDVLSPLATILKNANTSKNLLEKVFLGHENYVYLLHHIKCDLFCFLIFFYFLFFHSQAVGILFQIFDQGKDMKRKVSEAIYLHVGYNRCSIN